MNFKSLKLYNRKSCKPSYEKPKNEDKKSKSVERYINYNLEYRNSNSNLTKDNNIYSLKNSRNGSRKKTHAEKNRYFSKIWILFFILIIYF